MDAAVTAGLLDNGGGAIAANRTVTLDVEFTDPAGVARSVPGFWDGGNRWKVRYASGLPGRHGFRSRSSATGVCARSCGSRYAVLS